MAIHEVLDAETAWFCEFDEAPSKILAHHWPDIPNLGDVTKVNWADIPPVDIIAGGSPCQDLSQAGKRAGMTEGTRSNLWVNMREAIRVIKPRLVVWENVRGALSAKAKSESDMESENGQMGNLKALGRVLGDLAEIGYDARWTTIRASDVGAPHQRARVYLIAYPAHPGSVGRDERGGEGNRWLPPIRGAEIHSPKRDSETSAHAERFGRERGWATPGQEEGAQSPADRLRPVVWGDYEPAIRRWEGVVGPAPAPTEPNRNGRPRLRSEFSEWVMGLPAGHVTGVAGLSRAEQLRAIGNGVVPQQAEAALRVLLGSNFSG